LAEQVLGLRAAHLPRAGFGLTVGFPTSRLRDFVARALGRGWPVVLVMQRRRAAAPWRIERAPRLLWAARRCRVGSARIDHAQQSASDTAARCTQRSAE
jgi:hypothetical protein